MDMPKLIRHVTADRTFVCPVHGHEFFLFGMKQKPLKQGLNYSQRNVSVCVAATRIQLPDTSLQKNHLGSVAATKLGS